MNENFSKADEIKKLKELLDAGVLTQQEFDSQKQLILGGTIPQRTVSTSTPAPAPQVKRTSTGCVSAIILFAIFCLLVIPLGMSFEKNSPTDSTSSSSQTTSEDLLAFDNKTWSDFEKIYTAHNSFMNTVDLLGSQKIDYLSFYNACTETKEYFQKASIGFSYGKTEDEKTYLSTFKSACLSDQMAAQDFIKYIETGKIEHLPSANKNIQNAKDAIVMIAKNRGALLAMTDLTQDEIEAKISEDMEALDKKVQNQNS